MTVPGARPCSSARLVPTGRLALLALEEALKDRQVGIPGHRARWLFMRSMRQRPGVERFRFAQHKQQAQRLQPCRPPRDFPKISVQGSMNSGHP